MQIFVDLEKIPHNECLVSKTGFDTASTSLLCDQEHILSNFRNRTARAPKNEALIHFKVFHGRDAEITVRFSILLQSSDLSCESPRTNLKHVFPERMVGKGEDSLSLR